MFNGAEVDIEIQAARLHGVKIRFRMAQPSLSRTTARASNGELLPGLHSFSHE